MCPTPRRVCWQTTAQAENKRVRAPWNCHGAHFRMKAEFLRIRYRHMIDRPRVGRYNESREKTRGDTP